MPVPVTQRRRRQAPASSQAPRRSRRIAKLPPELNHQAAATICRQLGFTDANNNVTSASTEKYASFFDKPLSREHVTALAALLGKEVPENTQVLQEQVGVEA